MTEMHADNAYHETERGALRAVPWWHRLAYIQRRLPVVLAEAVESLALATGNRVLDFGCADRPYRALLAEDIDYVGADLPGNRQADVHIDQTGRLPDDLGGFDAVLSTQVLEHVADPALYLQEALRVLKPGGRLLLSTHGMMVYHPDPVDYWRWTGAGLEKLLTDHGFEVLSLRGVVGLAPTGLQFFQDAVWGRLPRLLRPPFALCMQGLIALCDRMHSERSRRYNALVFIVQARKPLADSA